MRAVVFFFFDLALFFSGWVGGGGREKEGMFFTFLFGGVWGGGEGGPFSHIVVWRGLGVGEDRGVRVAAFGWLQEYGFRLPRHHLCTRASKLEQLSSRK